MTHKTLANVKSGTLISYEKKVQVYYTSYLVFVTLLILALSSTVQ